jgi:large subunit ribosomal protein L21
VVEKLQGEPGDEIRFDHVLLVGDEAGAVVGAPTVEGAAVTAALVETRKGEKIKIFKKTRRQGYRRTRGHRQQETVLRVLSLNGGGKSAKWDGEVDLTPRATLVARSRGLVPNVGAGVARAAALTPAGVEAVDVVEDVAGPVVHAAVVEHGDAVAAEAPKKARAKKAEAEAPAADAAPKKTRAKKAAAEEGSDLFGKSDDAEGGEA